VRKARWFIAVVIILVGAAYYAVPGIFPEMAWRPWWLGGPRVVEFTFPEQHIIVYVDTRTYLRTICVFDERLPNGRFCKSEKKVGDL
jgi:hypothetical protein